MKTRRSLDDLLVLAVFVANVVCACLPVLVLAWAHAPVATAIAG